MNEGWGRKEYTTGLAPAARDRTGRRLDVQWSAAPRSPWSAMAAGVPPGMGTDLRLSTRSTTRSLGPCASLDQFAAGGSPILIADSAAELSTVELAVIAPRHHRTPLSAGSRQAPADCSNSISDVEKVRWSASAWSRS
jgi:hypothetical protein